MKPFLQVAVFALVGCAVWAEDLPNPAILTQQFEAQERERSINRRIEFQLARGEAMSELQFQRYRLAVVNGWPDSAAKTATVQAIEARIERLQTAINDRLAR
jgi:hypothetical protein